MDDLVEGKGAATREVQHRTGQSLLGHRTLESTCVYLRLAVDDIRDVALPLPAVVERGAPGAAS